MSLLFIYLFRKSRIRLHTYNINICSISLFPWPALPKILFSYPILLVLFWWNTKICWNDNLYYSRMYSAVACSLTASKTFPIKLKFKIIWISNEYLHIIYTLHGTLSHFYFRRLTFIVYKGRVQKKKKYGNFHTFADPPPLKYGK